MELSIYDAKTGFSKVIAAVEAGEEVIVKRRNKPVARISPIRSADRRRIGLLKGHFFKMGEDFDEPSGEEFADLFGVPKQPRR